MPPVLCYCGSMITVDDEEIKQFESDLKTFAARAYPFATRETLDTAAASAREGYVANARNQMITRNKFTEDSILFKKSGRTLNVNRQFSIVGSTAPYMETQEFGGMKSKGGKIGTPIPTTSASGEGEGVQPRRRVVPRSRALGRITLRTNKAKTFSKKQKNFLKIKFAAKAGHRFVFLDTQRHPGIYRVTGGVKHTEVTLMWDMSKESVIIPRNPMLASAVEDAERVMPFIYRDALIFQLKRHGLFKD